MITKTLTQSNGKLGYINQHLENINSCEHLKKLYYFTLIIYNNCFLSLEIVSSLIEEKCTSIDMLLELIKKESQIFNRDTKFSNIRKNLKFDEELKKLINLVQDNDNDSKGNDKFKEYMKKSKEYIFQGFNESSSLNHIKSAEKDSLNELQYKQSINKTIENDDGTSSKKVEQIELKPGFTLPLIKLKTNNDGSLQYQYYGQQRKNDKYKTIVFIGKREDGKTTLLNAFANYYFGITWSDKERVIVADQEQTTEISHYYIQPLNQKSYGIHLIDTPGVYGQNDKQTITKVSNFLQENKYSLDIIIVCFNATYIRLTVEVQQILQSIVEIIGQDSANKIIVARTFYSGGKVDSSTLTSSDSPFHKLLAHLSQNWHLEFNGQSIIEKTDNESAKVYYTKSMQNFQKIQDKLLLDHQQTIMKTENISSGSITQNEVYQSEYQYQKVFQNSYNQLKVYFMQNLRLDNVKKQQEHSELQKQVIPIETFALNCKKCQITCFVGFQSNQDAELFLNKELDGKSYCGCKKLEMIIMNEQWQYQEVYYSRSEQHQNLLNTQTIFIYLNKLFQMKEKNSQKSEKDLIEILKQEVQKDLQILQQFQIPVCGDKHSPSPQNPNNQVQLKDFQEQQKNQPIKNKSK